MGKSIVGQSFRLKDQVVVTVVDRLQAKQTRAFLISQSLTTIPAISSLYNKYIAENLMVPLGSGYTKDKVLRFLKEGGLMLCLATELDPTDNEFGPVSA